MDLLEELPEQYHAPLAAAGIKDAETLARNWIDAQSMLGSSIRLPPKDAAPDDIAAFDARLSERVPGLVRLPDAEDKEGWGRFYGQLGRPEKPEGYTFEKVEGVADNVEQNIRTWTATLAHENGLTQAQAKKVYEGLAASNRDNAQAFTTTIEERRGVLKREWGQTYDQHIEIARGLVKRYGGEEALPMLEQELSASGLAENPTIMKILARAGVDLGEDTLIVERDTSRIPRGLSEIAAKIGELQAHPGYRDTLHPMSKSVVAQVEQLYQEKNALQGTAA